MFENNSKFETMCNDYLLYTNKKLKIRTSNGVETYGPHNIMSLIIKALYIFDNLGIDFE